MRRVDIDKRPLLTGSGRCGMHRETDLRFEVRMRMSLHALRALARTRTTRPVCTQSCSAKNR